MKKHVLLIVPFYPDEQNPFAGRFFQEHAEALTPDFDVSVIFTEITAFSKTKSLSPKITFSDERRDVFVIRASQSVLSQRFSYWVEKKRQKLFHDAFEILLTQKGKPDFIFAETGFPPAKLAFDVFREQNIPFGILDHYSFTSKMFADHKTEWPDIYKSATFRAAVSTALQLVVRASTGFTFPVEVLPNTLSSQILERPVLPFPSQNPFRWIFIGRNHPVKQPELLFEAFSMLPENHMLTVVGLGDSHASMQYFSKEIQSRIRFLSGMKASDLWTEMEKHHALICTSSIETFGMAPLEMLALGRPVVTTPCGGPEQFISSENGRVSKDFSPTQIALCMNDVQTSFNAFSPEFIATKARSAFNEAEFARIFHHLSAL